MAGDMVSARRTEVRLKVRRDLALRIRRGEYSPGAWLPTERELAQEFGVDRATVRAALTDLAQDGLIVREYGRRPWVNETLQPDPGLWRDRALSSVAVILPLHPRCPAGAAILRGVSRALQNAEAGQTRLVLFDTYDEDPAAAARLERQALQSAERDDLAGVVYWGRDEDEALGLLESLRARHVPVVFVYRPPLRAEGDFIGSDYRWGVAEAVNHLVGLGHRRLAFAGSESDPSPLSEQVAGFQSALAAHSLPALAGEQVLRFGAGTPGLDEALARLIGQPEPPTGIIAAHDVLAVRVREALARLGKRVPEDVSVVGFDDLEQGALQAGFLTSVHQPYDRIGLRAGELILQRVRERREGREGGIQHILLSTNLVVRASAGPVATAPAAPAAA